MTSEKAEKFISKHIKRHKQMGIPQKQAVAVALHEARDKGFKVPRGVSRMEHLK